MSTPLVCHGLDVVSQLGQGYSAAVQLVNSAGQLLALKVFKAQQQEACENEIRILQLLADVPGVIRMRDTRVHGCIMMDYASQGTLRDYVQLERLPEPIARAYFAQMVQTIELIHKKGIAHRDLKLDNLLIGENHQLLVCDFGFAVLFMDSTTGRRIKINSYLGTEETAAPELYLQQPYHPKEADLFQLGVILFQLCAGVCPFRSANIKSDQVYQLLYKKQTNMFWQHHSGTNFSAELKDIITRLLAYNPNQRLSISEINSHTWMRHPKADEREIALEMQKRWDTILLNKSETNN